MTTFGATVIPIDAFSVTAAQEEELATQMVGFAVKAFYVTSTRISASHDVEELAAVVRMQKT